MTQPWGLRCWPGRFAGSRQSGGTQGSWGAGHVPGTRSEQIVGPHPCPGRWTFRRFTTTFPVVQTTFHLLSPENSPSIRPARQLPLTERPGALYPQLPVPGGWRHVGAQPTWCPGDRVGS